jgi:hypothetical protein
MRHGKHDHCDQCELVEAVNKLSDNLGKYLAILAGQVTDNATISTQTNALKQTTDKLEATVEEQLP